MDALLFAIFFCDNRQKSAIKTLCGLGVLARKTLLKLLRIKNSVETKPKAPGVSEKNWEEGSKGYPKTSRWVRVISVR